MIYGKERVNGMEVVFRSPKKTDVKEVLEYINSLIEEDARILLRKKATLKEEKEWLKGRIEGGKKGKFLSVFIEVNGKVSGIAELERSIGTNSSDSHVAKAGFGIKKEYRRMGLVGKAVEIIEKEGKKRWGLRIIKSSYVEDNKASEKIHKKLGFRAIGSIPKGTKYGNKYLDEVIVIKELWNSQK